ncbi:hypothetical protein [Methanobrevibacter sp.]|uniref:hypothetical protein n=1 Tax=Methanobrevibacter sp. TaxID=66852 RepID=UPI0038645C9C
MSKQKIDMDYRIKIIGGGLPKPKRTYEPPIFPDPAMEIFTILREDSVEGEWLRKHKAWMDKKINERCKNNKIKLYTPNRLDSQTYQFMEFPSKWEDL